MPIGDDLGTVIFRYCPTNVTNYVSCRHRPILPSFLRSFKSRVHFVGTRVAASTSRRKGETLEARARDLSFPQFSRSCVGGSAVLPFPAEFPGVESTASDAQGRRETGNENDVFFLAEAPRGPREEGADLRFESRFESGNLGKVVKITDTYYQLHLRRDLYTQRHTQWYYFRVSNTRSKITYRCGGQLRSTPFSW